MNYTDAETPYTRIIEHKWFTFGKDEEGRDLPKTVISKEYSSEWHPGDEPYYPVNDGKNGALYAQYRALADKEPRVVFGGRLGEYRYYDMDAVITGSRPTIRSMFTRIMSRILRSRGRSLPNCTRRTFRHTTGGWRKPAGIISTCL